MKLGCLIIGAGFAGAVCAERFANAYGKSVLVVKKRSHIGGNAFDIFDDFSILIHRYNPHIFHTKIEEVWTFPVSPLGGRISIGFSAGSKVSFPESRAASSEHLAPFLEAIRELDHREDDR